MARSKKHPEPPEDIPAWFMTYSDVITLLMTFFILLLTFSTTEPERFEKVQKSLFANGAASGIAGDEIDGPEQDSFVQRVRPRSSRIALSGAEMVPYYTEPSNKSVGKGLKTLSSEESKQDVMSTHTFELKQQELFEGDKSLTPKGAFVAKMFSDELRKLPMTLALEVSNQELFDKATTFASHMIDKERIRPGQIGIAIVDQLNSDTVRFSVERYETKGNNGPKR